MSVVPFVDLVAQYQTIKPEVDAAIGEVLATAGFILGPKVDAFEKAFAEFSGARFGIGVSNGLDALRVAMSALDIGPGHEVILPANTYIATAFAVSAVGARPVLVDCDEGTYNIDAGAVASVISPRTKAIMPVHLTGQAADMDAILEIAERHGLPVIEDAAQAHGTLHQGRPCGSMGRMGCFSFYPGKNLGAYGDAGLVTTSDPALDERLRRIRNYGQRAKYEHVEAGLNARLDALQAAVLSVKLRHLRGWNEARAQHAKRYRELLGGVGDIVMQTESSYSTHIYHIFAIQTERRDALQKHLEQGGVQTVIHYPVPIHLQEAYRWLGYTPGAFPRTERLARRLLSLPMFPELTEAQIESVAARVRSFYDGR